MGPQLSDAEPNAAFRPSPSGQTNARILDAPSELLDLLIRSFNCSAISRKVTHTCCTTVIGIRKRVNETNTYEISLGLLPPQPSHIFLLKSDA